MAEDIRGKKITVLRAKIVHFDFSEDKTLPNIELLRKITEIFESLIYDFIFKHIEVNETIRNELLTQQEISCGSLLKALK